MEPAIIVQNLKKSYPLAKPANGEKTFEAVKGISFNVMKGEIFGILGPNGAGKTTTLEIIETLKQQSEGEIKVLGLDNLKDPIKIKKLIGVQLQSSEYLPLLTLGELLDLFASLYNSKADKTKLLSLVGLEEKENEEVKNLSGGQKQRFTITTSLVNNPKILFLDEPTTGLDPSARKNLWALIKQINKTGITIVMTTHYMEEAEYLCNRVAILDKGKILTINEPKKLIEDLAHTTGITFLIEKEINQNIFKNIPSIDKIYSQYPKVILEINSLDHISQIIKTLKDNNINFSGFTVKTASLEDVYLDLTGKEFESNNI